MSGIYVYCIRFLAVHFLKFILNVVDLLYSFDNQFVVISNFVIDCDRKLKFAKSLFSTFNSS
jgi:hypothetical protein